MTPIDATPTPSTRPRRRPARTPSASVAAVADVDRPQGDRAAVSSAVARSPSRPTAVLGVLLGARARRRRRHRCSTPTRSPQLFAAVPRRARVRRRSSRCCSASPLRVVPLQLGARALAFPRLAAGRVLGLARRPVLVDRRRSPTTAGPAAATPTWSTCSSPPTALIVVGLAAAARARRHDRCSPPGRRACDAAGAAVLLVGAGRRDRAAARAAGAGRRAHLPLRRPPLRPGAVRRQRRHRRRGSASPHPAGDLPVRPPGGRRRRRADPGHVPASGMPMRGVIFAGLALVGVAACRPSPSRSIHGLPWSGAASTSTTSATSSTTSLPYAIFTLLPLLGVVIVLGVGAARRQAGRPAAPPARSRRRSLFAVLRRRR